MAETRTLNSLPPSALEGRLLAHRRLIAMLVSALAGDQQRRMLDWIEERSILHDGQEDPGAVPDAEAVLEYALADEFRLLKRMIEDAG